MGHHSAGAAVDVGGAVLMALRRCRLSTSRDDVCAGRTKIDGVVVGGFDGAAQRCGIVGPACSDLRHKVWDDPITTDAAGSVDRDGGR